MNDKIQDAINEQINAEMHSGYIYLSMAAYLDAEGLTGFANWMKVQAQEEMAHAMKFYNYVYERNGKVILKPIAEVPTEFNSPLQIAEMVLEHEQKVTGLINDLYTLAKEEKDYAFESFLKWYIDEQVEEESSANAMIDKIKLAGSDGPGVFMLDKELGARVFNNPLDKAE